MFLLEGRIVKQHILAFNISIFQLKKRGCKMKNVKLKKITHSLIYKEMSKKMMNVLSEVGEMGETLQDVYERITESSAYSEIIKKITNGSEDKRINLLAKEELLKTLFKSDSTILAYKYLLREVLYYQEDRYGELEYKENDYDTTNSINFFLDFERYLDFYFGEYLLEEVFFKMMNELDFEDTALIPIKKQLSKIKTTLNKLLKEKIEYLF